MTETKHFQIRIPKDLWLFLKQVSIDENLSMAQIINDLVKKKKIKYEKKLDAA